MGEKSSAAEGSGIFESLFGGFSNGLSIFTNNPFRRRNDAVSFAEEDTIAENDGDLASAMFVNEIASGEEVAEVLVKKLTKAAVEAASLEKTGDVVEDGCGQIEMESEEQSESTLKKKVKRMEEEAVSEKKRMKTESVGDVRDDEDGKSASTDSRKRKQDLAVGGVNAEVGAGLDDEAAVVVESKKKKLKKKNRVESEQQPVLRQSARNLKKRQSEELLQGSGQKGRKVEKTLAENEGIGEKGSIPTVKRPQEVGAGGKHVKKAKRLKENESESPSASKEIEELVGGANRVETRLGSKRKKDIGVEESYERKRRETVDEQETTRVQGNEEQGDGGEHMEIGGDRLRGKRKLSSEADEEDELKGAKKKKTSKEDKKDNEERLKRTIFVGNLSVSVKTKHLSREFSQFGTVESARLRSVPLVDSKMPRKAAVMTGQLNESRTSLNGYVVFEKEESARAALAHNMAEFKGKHVRVDMATAPRKADNGGGSGIEYDRARSIFVGNLPFDVEDEELYSLFKGKSQDLEVEAVRVVRDPQTSIGKGFAFVCFKKKVGATTALDNAEYTRLRNRQLRIIRFGFQKKQQGHGNQSARTNTGNYKSKPRPGAEERLSKRSVLSYEGTRSSKPGGRPGKVTGPAQTSHIGKSDKRGGTSKSGNAGKKNGPTKRPAVAARKLALHGNSGPIGTGGGKRKREEKGIICLPPPPPVSTSAQLKGKLWSVVRSVGSFASSSFKDFLQESEIKSGAMSGSMRKLLFNIERPEKSSGATALRELSLVPFTRSKARPFVPVTQSKLRQPE